MVVWHMQDFASSHLPEAIGTEAILDELLTRPSAALVQFITSVRSPLVILGAGGKMGPTLAVLARRAAEAAGCKLDVIAVSRFSDPYARRWLEECGVQTLSCDLFDADAVRKLPDATDVLYLVGQKFGTTQSPAGTWAANLLVPARIAERYAAARIVALSTGNVYPLSPVADGGSMESDPLTPVGEYANATVGRERIFEFFSQQNGTPVVLLRLFYATDLRYGVLRDLADRVWNGNTIDLANGHFNCIWQGDANEMVIRSLALASSPATAFNLTSAEVIQIRGVATRLGELLGKPVTFSGSENNTALIGNTARLRSLLGDPPTPLDTMLRWTADWVKRGGRSLGKPTHFEVRDGRY
jgi:nucleoside-diphosphate-sugar epimerase